MSNITVICFQTMTELCCVGFAYSSMYFFFFLSLSLTAHLHIYTYKSHHISLFACLYIFSFLCFSIVIIRYLGYLTLSCLNVFVFAKVRHAYVNPLCRGLCLVIALVMSYVTERLKSEFFQQQLPHLVSTNENN